MISLLAVELAPTGCSCATMQSEGLEDLLLLPSQHVLRHDIASGAAPADVLVVVDVSAYQTPRIIERQSAKSLKNCASWPAQGLTDHGRRNSYAKGDPRPDLAFRPRSG
jgi:hypothetical protein